MGDTVSEASTSINWARDELEFVDEIRLDKQPSSKESLIVRDSEEPVSAAVSLVVSSARHGVVALCANVAHILREKKKLKQRVAELEKQMIALENRRNSGTVSVNGSCSVHCQATDVQYSLQESPISQRCGSAPASFIASGLKFLRTDYQNDIECTQNGGLRHGNRDNKCGNIQESRAVECRTSSISMPETHSKIINGNNKDHRKTGFIRGPSQASTRSLNIARSLPASSFVRKYSMVSLRRVRRSAANRQKTSSTCSTNSVNSNGSNINSEEQHKCNGSSSCIITVAEVHTPPGQQDYIENTEGDAVKLLARRLTSVLQGDGTDQENCPIGSPEVGQEVNDSHALKPQTQQEFCLPHPLAGCECVICLRLAADQNCHLYALTTEGGSLLPHGSRVLLEGERVGTVVYFGHEKYSTKIHSSINPASTETPLAQEACLRPVGVTVKLWAPDQGEIFVPLNAVICQLDDDLDIHRKESLSNFEFEYVDEEDSDEEYILSNPGGSMEYPKVGRDVSDVEAAPPEISIKTESQESRSSGIKDWKPIPEDYFVRSPSVSSYSSDISHSLGDLSVYGLECGDDELEFSKEVNFRDNLREARSSCRSSYTHDPGSQLISRKFGDETQEISCSRDNILNTTFISKAVDEDLLPRTEMCQDYNVSLYDTCDSAISLSFTKRLQHSEDNSEPSSITDTGRESPHFGDTWDSGCSVGRGRCKSDSSGHFSDMELDNTRLGNTFTKSLGDALNVVLQKHKMKSNSDLEKHKISDRNIYNDITPVNIEFSKRFQRKDTFHCNEFPLKDKECFPSYKYEETGNIPDQSEV